MTITDAQLLRPNIPHQQQVAVYHSNKDVRVENRPVPEIGPDELLLEIRASGLCGSDLLEWYRLQKAPLVLGHEVSGIIVCAGAQVTRFRVGQRVAVSHHVPCNVCRYCLSGHETACDTLHSTNFDPGGYAQYVRVPAINIDRGVFPIPDKLTFAEGAFFEPLACVLRSQRVIGVGPGQTVAVLGAGTSGILHIALARALHASRIIATDVSPFRLEQALRFGAHAAIDANDDVPLRIREANNGRGADLVVVCVGIPAVFEQAMESVDRGGTILAFATTHPDSPIKIPLARFWRNDITLRTSYGNAPRDAVHALELIRTGAVPVGGLITHRLPLSEIQEGFDLVASGASRSLKVLIEPNGPEEDALD